MASIPTAGTGHGSRASVSAWQAAIARHRGPDRPIQPPAPCIPATGPATRGRPARLPTPRAIRSGRGPVSVSSSCVLSWSESHNQPGQRLQIADQPLRLRQPPSGLSMPSQDLIADGVSILRRDGVKFRDAVSLYRFSVHVPIRNRFPTERNDFFAFFRFRWFCWGFRVFFGRGGASDAHFRRVVKPIVPRGTTACGNPGGNLGGAGGCVWTRGASGGIVGACRVCPLKHPPWPLSRCHVEWRGPKPSRTLNGSRCRVS